MRVWSGLLRAPFNDAAPFCHNYMRHPVPSSNICAERSKQDQKSKIRSFDPDVLEWNKRTSSSKNFGKCKNSRRQRAELQVDVFSLKPDKFLEIFMNQDFRVINTKEDQSPINCNHKRLGDPCTRPTRRRP